MAAKEDIVVIKVGELENARSGVITKGEKHHGKDAIYVDVDICPSGNEVITLWGEALNDLAKEHEMRVVLRHEDHIVGWADPGEDMEPQEVPQKPSEDEMVAEGAEPTPVAHTPAPQASGNLEYEVAQALYWCMQHNCVISLSPATESNPAAVVSIDLDWYAANPDTSDHGHIAVQRSHFLPAVQALQAYLQSINYGANTVI